MNSRRFHSRFARTQHPWRAGCKTGKLTYRSQWEASFAATQAGRQGKQQVVYLCRHCNAWHVASERARAWPNG